MKAGKKGYHVPSKGTVQVVSSDFFFFWGGGGGGGCIARALTLFCVISISSVPKPKYAMLVCT